jgi:hypothetical protein
MPRTHRWIAIGLLAACPSLVAQTGSAQSSAPFAGQPVISRPRPHKAHKAVKPLVLPPLPSGPLSQLPMDQIPSAPAKVTFQDGLLTISAQNSTLGEILHDVRQLTGASIEVPPGSGANERVVTHLGPGTPRDVLAGLLNGSSFNYVMVGSTSDPSAVSSVVLMPRQSSPGDVQTAANVPANVYQNDTVLTPRPSPFPQPFSRANLVAQPGNVQPGGAQPGVAPAANADADADAEDKDDDDSADDSDAQTGQAAPPGGIGNPQDQQQTDPSQPNAGPKTPEQILEMLRRQQPGSPTIPPPQPPQE